MTDPQDFLDLFGSFGHVCNLCGRLIQSEKEETFQDRMYGSSCFKKLVRRINLRQQGTGDTTQEICINCNTSFLQNRGTGSFTEQCPSESLCCACCVFSLKSNRKFCPAEDQVRTKPDLAKKYHLR